MMGITGITGMMGTSGMTGDEGDGLTRATGVTGASKERYEGEGENVSIAGMNKQLQTTRKDRATQPMETGRLRGAKYKRT